MRVPALVHQISGPLASYASGLDARLQQVGYRPRSRAIHLGLVAGLSRWLGEQGLAGEDLDESVVERFVREHPSGSGRVGRSVRSFAVLLGFLRDAGVVGPRVMVRPTGPVEVFLGDYSDYLRAERGLVAATIRRDVGLVRPFVAGRVRDGRLDLASLDADDVTTFMVDRVGSVSSAQVQLIGTALRSLLGYVHLRGLIGCSLTGAVPSAARWRAAGLVKYLTPDEVDQMLGSCDRHTVVGCRNVAILLLLARLGLRAGEVAALSLDDVDWRAGEIVVRGKAARRERLPLPPDVGEALASYLSFRPQEATVREVFVTVRAPLRALSRGSVTQIVARASTRCGLGTVYAHRLRHTAATSMLQAGGSLEEIGQVLRHQRMLTTAIYAKVDHDGLRPLARRWPTLTAP